LNYFKQDVFSTTEDRQMGDTAKQQWTPPTVTEFDIAERTQLGGAGLDDGLEPGGLDEDPSVPAS
jgi:hypothetical protein